MATLKDHCDYMTDLDKRAADLDAWALTMSIWVAATQNYLDEVHGALVNAGIPYPHGTGVQPPPPPQPKYP